MHHIVVFIPGIMGSSLRRKDKELWSADMLGSLSQLDSNPQLLKLDSANNDEPYEILERLMLNSKLLSTPVYNLCGALRQKLREREKAGDFSYVEFPYDWRRDNKKTADKLRDLLSNHGFDLTDGRQAESETHRLTIIAHSMGNLVVAIALKCGFIHPKNVHYLISIGAPFLGAPNAFKGLYTTGYLPPLDWMEIWIGKGRNPVARRNALLQTMQSFSSIYQLLPPVANQFVRLSTAGPINPLTQNFIPQDKKDAANGTHSYLYDFENFLITNSVNYRLIYGTGEKASLRQRLLYWLSLTAYRIRHLNTDSSYNAKIGQTSWGATFIKIKVRDKTPGDGTVPEFSASLMKEETAPNRRAIPDIDHMTMCNDSRVVDLVAEVLPTV
jgi:pimeloyl-ACP methyl ester carboxylesterase